MPTYRVTDPQTGKTLRLTGDSPPTEQELTEIFSQYQPQQAEQAAPAEGQVETQPQGKSVAGFAGNVASSAGDLLKNLFTAITHPVQTVKTTAQIPIGLGAKARRELEEKRQRKSFERSESEQVWDSVVDMIKGRYGSVENIKETAYKDPVGMLADVAAVVSAGAGAIGKVGEASKISRLSKVGKVGSKVGSAVDPLQAMVKGITKVDKGIKSASGTAASETLGATTGVGADIIKTAYSKPDEVIRAMRGKVSPEQIVKTTKSALASIKNKQGSEYRKQLSKVREQSGTNINFGNIKSSLKEALDDFDVKIKGKKLDFRDSSLEGSGQTAIKEVADTVNNWKDYSVKGIDNLKKRIGEIYTPTNQARAGVQAVKSAITKELKQVPGYEKMTSKYSEASKLLKELKSGLSLSDRASIQTTLNKLSVGVKKSDFRQELIEQLNKTSNKDLVAQIAGGQLNQLAPRGLTGSLIKILGLGGVAFPGTRGAALAALASSSPRIVGEVVAGAGKASKVARKMTVPTSKIIGKVTSSPTVNTLLRMLGITQNKISDKTE
jgi:hypothetical protein